jgi:hypothetical protein
MTIQIEIDQDVFTELEKRVQGFSDTPNTVLRRLLGVDARQSGSLSSSSRNTLKNSMIESDKVSSKQFVHQILLEEFGQGFQRRGRYPYMFENKNRLVYFQNFNAAYHTTVVLSLLRAPHISP